nr:eukaryotic translation initiation factor 2A-like [Lytechinus pictus]
MASISSIPCPQLTVRGTEGVYMISGPPSFTANETFGRDDKCTVMTYSADGRLFAYSNSDSVFVTQLPECETLLQLDKPKTLGLVISPSGKYLATWEVYFTSPTTPGPNPNAHIWEIQSGRCVKSFIMRQNDIWKPQWTDDERICAIQANSEIHFFENGNYENIANRLHLPKVMCRISGGGSPAHVAAHIPGNKGAPHAVRLFRYPNFDGPGAMIANKSFYKADSVDMIWNKKGSAVLVIATQEVDTTGSSYYGETALHFLAVNGDSSNVTVGKKGPVYSVDWNPNSAEFCVVYGFMPAKATLFNLKCEPIFDFGTGPRNCVYFNPQGTIIALGGFANLRGHIQLWDRKNLKMISESQAADATVFQWSPDGQHYATAVCAPRLRVGNGFKVWHVSGSLLHEFLAPSDSIHIYDVAWQTLPADLFRNVPISKPTGKIIQSSEPQASKEAYRPPGARGKPASFKLNEIEPPQAAPLTEEQKLSKSALKNKKKRDAKNKGKPAVTDNRSAEQRAALATASYVLSEPAPAPAVGVDVEAEKKIKNVRKKLKAIEKLKEQQASGKELEKNQLDKLSTEDELRRELAKLEIQ